jgi:hypothetical protein
VRRAASRFALVAAAGELATAAGITGWQEGESLYSAQVCFKSWLGRRGTTVADIPGEVIHHVRHFIEAQDTRKAQLPTSAPGGVGSLAAGSRFAGFRRGPDGGTTYFVDPDVFRRDACAGFDPKVVLRTLKVNGFLERDLGRLDKSIRLPGAGKKRVYAIKASILEGQPLGVTGNGDSGDTGDNHSALPKPRPSIRRRPAALRSLDSAATGTAVTAPNTTTEDPEVLGPSLNRSPYRRAASAHRPPAPSSWIAAA